MTANDTRDEWLDRHRSLAEYERVGYLGLGESYNKRLYWLRRRHLLRLLRRVGFDPKCRILDIGSGTGFYVDLYRGSGATDVSGVDLSPDAVRLLWERYPEYRFATGDVAEGLPADLLDSGSFELVSAMDVLYHITYNDRWRSALRLCGEAVAPGGLLLVTDYFPPRPLPATASQAFHTLAEHEAILTPVGFRLIELTPVFYFSNGQVSAGGGGKVMATYWHAFSSLLGKTLRTSRPLGELLGATTGVALTALDAMLQSQSIVKGYSTKVAVFRRA